MNSSPELSTLSTDQLREELFARSNQSAVDQTRHQIHLAIAADVAKACQVDREDLLSRSRRAHLTYPRFMLMKIERALGWNLPAIAVMFGYDHSTIMHGLQRHAVRSRTDTNYHNATVALMVKHGQKQTASQP
jgi:chromosomal replication initiation ATPase DnaA